MGEISHILQDTGGSFVFRDHDLTLAEMTYSRAGSTRLIIASTHVDPSLKGKGIGKELLEELVSYARNNQIQVIPLCPFAKATFEKMQEWQDVL